MRFPVLVSLFIFLLTFRLAQLEDDIWWWVLAWGWLAIFLGEVLLFVLDKVVRR